MWVKPRENGYSKKWNMVKNYKVVSDAADTSFDLSETDLAWWHEHVVTKPAGDDRVMHDSEWSSQYESFVSVQLLTACLACQRSTNSIPT